MATAQHIVILFHDFSFGGTEVVALRLAAEWLKMGHRVTIVCGTLDGPMIGSVPAGAQIRTLEPEIGRSPLSRWRLRRALPAAIERLRADILFLPGNFHLILGGAVRDLRRAPKVVAKISNPLAPTQFGPVRWLFERLYQWAARDVDALVAMSAGLAEDARRIACDRRTCVIHDPNILPGLPPLRNRTPSPTLRMVAAGRLVAQKDFGLALRVTAELARCRDVRLAILGEGPERLKLERLARDLGIGRLVEFRGQVPTIAPALEEADLLLVTSRFEGGPAVAVEALWRSTPVLATDCSHFLKDLLHRPEYGRIVSSRDPSAIAREIQSWLAGPDHRTFSGRVIGEAFDARNSASKYIRLFDEIRAGVRAAKESEMDTLFGAADRVPAKPGGG